jgi:hypothetical protein
MNSVSSHSLSLGLALAVSALGSGCVGTGPNTQQGAVSGATVGAIAGAIIGNNSGHRTLEGAAIGAAAGAMAGGTLGNAADHQQGTLYTSPEAATTNYYATQPPPPPPQRVEVVNAVRPAPAAVWINGYWLFDGRGYLWVASHWEVPPPRCHVYVTPRWVRHHHGRYVYIRGYWQ